MHNNEYTTPPQPKSASQVVIRSRMQLTLHVARRNTSRRFALGASIVCLVDENPRRALRSGIVGMRGSMYGLTNTATHDNEYSLDH